MNATKKRYDLPEKTVDTLDKWIKIHGSKKTTIKLIGALLNTAFGISFEELGDTDVLNTEIGKIRWTLEKGEYDEAIEIAKNGISRMLKDKDFTSMINEIKKRR